MPCSDPFDGSVGSGVKNTVDAATKEALESARKSARAECAKRECPQADDPAQTKVCAYLEGSINVEVHPIDGGRWKAEAETGGKCQCEAKGADGKPTGESTLCAPDTGTHSVFAKCSSTPHKEEGSASGDLDPALKKAVEEAMKNARDIGKLACDEAACSNADQKCTYYEDSVIIEYTLVNRQFVATVLSTGHCICKSKPAEDQPLPKEKCGPHRVVSIGLSFQKDEDDAEYEAGKIAEALAELPCHGDCGGQQCKYREQIKKKKDLGSPPAKWTVAVTATGKCECQ